MKELSDLTDQQIIEQVKERHLHNRFIADFDDDDILKEVSNRNIEHRVPCDCSIDEYGNDDIMQEVRGRDLEDKIIGDQFTHAKLCDLFVVSKFTSVKKLLKMLKSKLMKDPETARAYQYKIHKLNTYEESNNRRRF